MMTWNEFINEKKNGGNYVSIGATLEQGDADIRGGKFTKEPHVTLMYSEGTDISESDIQKVLENYKEPIDASFDEVEIFKDSKGGSAVVLKLKSDVLNSIHKDLNGIGLKHTYDPFTPHVTFAYKLEDENAKLLKDDLNGLFEGKTFTLQNYVVQPINYNWVDDDS